MAEEPPVTDMLTFTSNSTLGSIASVQWWKNAAPPSLFIWPKFTISSSHSSPNSSISLPFHSDVPRACSCPWETDVLLGIMAKCHIFFFFYPFTSCFVVRIVLRPFSRFGRLCMECMWVCLLCLCVCVLNLDRAVCLRTLLPQLQTPSAVAFYSPNPQYRCLCVCRSRVLFTTSPLLPILLLAEEHRTRVRRLPSSHL